MIEKDKILRASCFIAPKEFSRLVDIKYTDDSKKYFVVGQEYDSITEEYEGDIPITMTDSFAEAEEAAWNWIEAGPRLSEGR